MKLLLWTFVVNIRRKPHRSTHCSNPKLPLLFSCLAMNHAVDGSLMASSVGGPGFNPQSRTASYQRPYENGISSSLVWHSTLKREVLALSQELRSVIEILRSRRSLAVVAGMKKPEWPRRTDKCRTLKRIV